MTTGTFNVSRGIWDDSAFKAEPFTEREAWIWMVSEAAWKPHTRRVGNYVVELDRGQLAGSVRFLASKWKWTAPRVQRYLKRVENLKMICVKTDTGLNVITVCKYDKYQAGGKAADTAPIQDRYTTDTKEKKGERRKEGEVEEPIGSMPIPRSPTPTDEIAQAVSAYNAEAERNGWAQIQKMTPARRSAMRGRLRDVGGVDGWLAAMERAAASSFLCGHVESARGSPFRMTFDFITRQSSFTKLMEGNYDDRPATQNRPAHRPEHRLDPAVANCARLAGLG